MADRLYVWAENTPVGRFDRNDDRVTFTYDDTYRTAVSLSLPREGGWVNKAPIRFLDNLLPDNPTVREIMAQTTHAVSTDTFDLLDGADVSGGLTFTRNEEPPAPTPATLIPADNQAIAARIARIKAGDDTRWWDPSVPVRFSLAGNQPKFSLARIGSHWFWSNAAMPSTHILKPGEPHRPGVQDVEAASMLLSRLCGVPTPQAGVESFGDQDTYIIERFDRRRDATGHIHRIHTEDMMQAIGDDSGHKYGVKAKQVLAVLHRADPDDALSYEWVRRLALNTSISNVDAHAKNYSIMFGSSGPSIAPMYDVLTTTYWPDVDRRMPMEIGGVRVARELEPRHWRRFAKANGLDEDAVEEIARTMAWRVLEHADEAYRGLDPVMAGRLKHQLELANLKIQPEQPDPATPAETKTGMVHVRSHTRDGRTVVDYWRRRPTR